MGDSPAGRNSARDQTAADEYWNRLFPLGRDRGAYFEWFRTNGARSWCQRMATIRNRARSDWIDQHGSDSAAWPLPHPPVVVWMPHSYTALCAECYWMNHRVNNGEEAGEAAIAHSLSRCHDEGALMRWGRPLKVWHDTRAKEKPPAEWVG